MILIKNKILIDHEWKEPRKILNLAFNLNVLKGFIPIFAQNADATIKDMEKHLNKKTFNLAHDIAALSGRSVSGLLIQFIQIYYIFIIKCQILATILNFESDDLANFLTVHNNINM